MIPNPAKWATKMSLHGRLQRVMFVTHKVHMGEVHKVGQALGSQAKSVEWLWLCLFSLEHMVCKECFGSRIVPDIFVVLECLPVSLC